MLTLGFTTPFIFMAPVEVRQVSSFYSNDQVIYNAIWGQVYDSFGEADTTTFVYSIAYEAINAKIVIVEINYNIDVFMFNGVVISVGEDKIFLENSDMYDGYTQTLEDVGTDIISVLIFGSADSRTGLISIYATPVG